MNEGASLVFVVSAPSGTGKSSVLARLIGEVARLRFSVSHTTRCPRSGETNGVDYFFVERREFERMVGSGDFLEWAEVHGQLYGTSRFEIERAQADGVDLMLDIDVQGASQVRERWPSAATIFLLPPSRGVLEGRLRGRGLQTEEDTQRRLGIARQEIERSREYDYLVVNDRLDECVSMVKSIVSATRCRMPRMRPALEGVIASFQGQEPSVL